MSDPIIQRVSQHAIEKAGQQGGQQPLAKVDPQDQAKFEDAYHQKESSGDANSEQVSLSDLKPADAADTSAIDAANTPAAEVQSADGGMAHDLITQVNKVDQSYHDAVHNAQAKLSQAPEDISPMDLMKTQMELMQTEATLEFTTKAADKVGTDVQTLANRQN